MNGADPAIDSELLLVHTDELVPVLSTPVCSASAPAEIEAAGPEAPTHLWDESIGANDLAAQRWGVIAPEGSHGDALLGRISRLIARRRDQQGGEIIVYRVAPGQSAAEATRWRKRHFEAPQIRRRDVPRYVLILGDLDEISPELQVVMSADGYVGRLAFDCDQEYEAYVDKILRWEAAVAPVSRARAVFHTVRDGTSATTVGHQALMVPGLAMARSYREDGDFFASDLVDVEHGYTPKPAPLIEEATKAEPGLLFTISHGAGAPRRGWRSVQEQRVLQGGMSFGRSGGLLTGEALAGHSFMPGGVWFMLACFGAGTPAHSKYEPWLRGLRSGHNFQGHIDSIAASLPHDGRPFIASVPKAVLASAHGPVAFIGHIDLAWTYSFRELDDERPVNRPGRFIDVLGGLLRGDRAGVAFRELIRHYGQTNTELTALVESGVDDPQRRGHLWMLRNDLAGYVLLGDPAVQLPIQARAASSSPVARDPYRRLGIHDAPPSSPPPPSAVDPYNLERAIGLYLAGEMGAHRILRECDLNIGRREFEGWVEQYIAAGRKALGLKID